MLVKLMTIALALVSSGCNHNEMNCDYTRAAKNALSERLSSSDLDKASVVTEDFDGNRIVIFRFGARPIAPVAVSVRKSDCEVIDSDPNWGE